MKKLEDSVMILKIKTFKCFIFITLGSISLYLVGDMKTQFFLGHGVDNAIVQIDESSYEVDEDGKKYVKGITPTGDCMVDCEGKLYSFHDLKLELLKCFPKRLMLTMDCCRSRQRKKEEYVILRHMEPIDESVIGKIAVIHGTQDLHDASDDHSFTQELYRIFENADGHEIPIVDIAREVNQNWEQMGLKQRCKLDITETGNNWRFYMWPTSYICFPKQNLDKDGTDVAMDESVGENEESQDLNGTVRGLQKKYDDLVPLVGKISLLEKKVEKLENENQSLEDEVAARPRKKARRKNEETK